MELEKNWKQVKNIFKDSFNSSFHYSIASVTEDGNPHVTPIGSLILGKPGQGFYFEKFPKNLPTNYKTSQQVCILAVNSSRWFWFKSLFAGSFSNPPAVRLHGTVGELRDASSMELNIWNKRVRSVKFTKGHALIWKGMSRVRDIKFHKIEPVNIGKMTENSWH